MLSKFPVLGPTMMLLSGCLSTPAETPFDAGPEDAGTMISAESGLPTSCVLGSVEHCGTCGHACPDTDDASATRMCTRADASGTCALICKAEFYDVDGHIENGCEAGNDPMRQDTVMRATPLTLPDGFSMSATPDGNPRNLLGFVLSDNAQHSDMPQERRLGLPDFYAVTAVDDPRVSGNGQPGVGFSACLSIVNHPANNEFELCVSDAVPTGGSVVFATPGGACSTVRGGAASACVTPPSGGDAGGPYYVRVRKLSGAHSPLGYALYMRH